MDYQIIDAHIHPFIRPENHITMYEKFPDVKAMFNELKSVGVAAVCGSVINKSSEPDSFEVVKATNADALKIQSEYPDFYYPGIAFHISEIEKSCEEIIRCRREQNVKFIGEILSYTTGAKSFSDPVLNPVWSTIAELKMPVNIHRINIPDIVALADNFPELNIIFAHPGEKNEYMQILEAMKTRKNLYLDLSGTGLFRYGMLEYGVKTVGADRFLFGSDFPICNCLMNIYGVLGEKLSPDINRQIFSENFLKLINR